MSDQESIEIARFVTRLGIINDSLIKKLSLELTRFLNEIENEKVLKSIVDNWDVLAAIPNPNYKADLKNYDEDPFAQLSPFDRWQIAVAHGSHSLGPSPIGEDAYKAPDPPSKFISFPNSYWKKLILSLTSTNVQTVIESLRIEKKNK